MKGGEERGNKRKCRTVFVGRDRLKGEGGETESGELKIREM